MHHPPAGHCQGTNIAPQIMALVLTIWFPHLSCAHFCDVSWCSALRSSSVLYPPNYRPSETAVPAHPWYTLAKTSQRIDLNFSSASLECFSIACTCGAIWCDVISYTPFLLRISKAVLPGLLHHWSCLFLLRFSSHWMLRGLPNVIFYSRSSLAVRFHFNACVTHRYPCTCVPHYPPLAVGCSNELGKFIGCSVLLCSVL